MNWGTISKWSNTGVYLSAVTAAFIRAVDLFSTNGNGYVAGVAGAVAAEGMTLACYSKIMSGEVESPRQKRALIFGTYTGLLVSIVIQVAEYWIKHPDAYGTLLGVVAPASATISMAVLITVELTGSTGGDLLQSLRDELHKLRDVLSDATKRNDTQQAELRQLQAQLEAATSSESMQLQMLRSDNNRLTAQLSSATRNNDAQQRELQQLRDELQTQRQTIESLQAQLQTASVLQPIAIPQPAATDSNGDTKTRIIELLQVDNGLTQTEIARRLGINKSTVSRACSALGETNRVHLNGVVTLC